MTLITACLIAPIVFALIAIIEMVSFYRWKRRLKTRPPRGLDIIESNERLQKDRLPRSSR